MLRHILISGAGVSGLALAYWLDRAGFAVTVVERQPAWRRGGQAVDIRGVALDVVRAMGLLDDVRELRTRLRGMSILDAEGMEVDRTTERTFSAGRLDSEDIEIFRDDLCQLLMNALGERVTFEYGDSIEAMVEEADGVAVTFASGRQRKVDLVIGADGVYSKTRRVWFDDEASVVKSLDVVLALFSVPNTHHLDDWQLAYRDENVGYVIYPSRDRQEIRVGVGFGTDGMAVGRDDVDAQKAMVAIKCAHLGGDFPRIIEAMKATSQFYYNELAQIRAPRWSRGRVVLAGDAAHCASPFSGQGTSLALVGAFVLARELVRHPDRLEDALGAYEARMRPFVALNQDMVDLSRKGPTPDEVMTRSKNGIDLRELLGELA